MATATRSPNLTYVGGYIPQAELDLIDAFAKSRLNRKGKPISRTVALRMLVLKGLNEVGLLPPDEPTPASEKPGAP